MFFSNSKLNYLESILDSLNYSYTYDKNQSLVDIHLYNFPNIVLNNTKKELECDDKTLELVKLDFFDYMYTIQKFKKVEMCSKTTSVLWKNLILDTKNYMEFCSTFVGFYVHFDPYVESMKPIKSYSSEMKDLYKKSIDNSDYIKYRNKIINDYKYDNNTDNNLINTYMLYSILDTQSESKNSYRTTNNYEDNSYNNDTKTSSHYSSYSSGDSSYDSGSSSSGD